MDLTKPTTADALTDDHLARWEILRDRATSAPEKGDGSIHPHHRELAHAAGALSEAFVRVTKAHAVASQRTEMAVLLETRARERRAVAETALATALAERDEARATVLELQGQLRVLTGERDALKARKATEAASPVGAVAPSP